MGPVRAALGDPDLADLGSAVLVPVDLARVDLEQVAPDSAVLERVGLAPVDSDQAGRERATSDRGNRAARVKVPAAQAARE